MTNAIAALKQQVEKLQQQLNPAPGPTEQDIRRAMDEMHQLREQNASRIPPWMRAAVAGGVTNADCADIIRTARAPQGASAQGAIPSGQQISNVRGGGPANVPGSGTGWQRAIPLSPPPGVNYADRLMDHQDAKDRRELIEQKAREAAALRAMKP
jgi:hypothetical protein